MVKAAWFRRFSPEDRPQAFNYIVQSWDTANKPGELSDYSVCTTWGVKAPNFYLIDVLRRKLSFPELKRAVIDQDARFSPQTILGGSVVVSIAISCARPFSRSPVPATEHHLHIVSVRCALSRC